uniref:Uncharacterized protein n=1 Tax=Anguilla anguilla TaxID=7936 RepID=A0A0E9QHY9_ANGAN
MVTACKGKRNGRYSISFSMTFRASDLKEGSDHGGKQSRSFLPPVQDNKREPVKL